RNGLEHGYLLQPRHARRLSLNWGKIVGALITPRRDHIEPQPCRRLTPACQMPRVVGWLTRRTQRPLVLRSMRAARASLLECAATLSIGCALAAGLVGGVGAGVPPEMRSASGSLAGCFAAGSFDAPAATVGLASGMRPNSAGRTGGSMVAASAPACAAMGSI